MAALADERTRPPHAGRAHGRDPPPHPGRGGREYRGGRLPADHRDGDRETSGRHVGRGAASLRREGGHPRGGARRHLRALRGAARRHPGRYAARAAGGALPPARLGALLQPALPLPVRDPAAPRQGRRQRGATALAGDDVPRLRPRVRAALLGFGPAAPRARGAAPVRGRTAGRPRRDLDARRATLPPRAARAAGEDPPCGAGQMNAFAERYGPWAAVLGAAQGIGLAFAHEIARRGANVLLVDVREDLLGPATHAVAAAVPGVEARAELIDLAAPDGGERLDAIDLELGLVVYTAMLALVGPFLDEKLERHERALHVGCRGALAASSVLGRRLVARGRGGLILTSSSAGFQGTGFVAGYSAAKAYDLALAEALWWEWRHLGVDVLALCPGGTATPGMLANQPKLGLASLARPEDVAREALDALGHGPLCIPGEDNRRARAALERLPREQLVALMGEQTRRMFRGE